MPSLKNAEKEKLPEKIIDEVDNAPLGCSNKIQ